MGVAIRSIRNGRKVIAYQIPAAFMEKAQELVAAKAAAPVKPAGNRTKKKVMSAAAVVASVPTVETEEVEETEEA